MKLGVLVSGTGTNLQAILDATKDGVLSGVAEVAVVVASRPRAKALDRARAAGVTTGVVDSRQISDRDAYDQALVEVLQKHEVELVCLAGFMRVLGPRLLAAFPDRVLNIHPSLLPAFPGLDAQKQAWEYGTKVAGCTVHFVDEGVDTGPIVAQAAVFVLDGDSEEDLRRKILAQEHRLYPAAIRAVAGGKVSRKGRRTSVDASEACATLSKPKI